MKMIIVLPTFLSKKKMELNELRHLHHHKFHGSA